MAVYTGKGKRKSNSGTINYKYTAILCYIGAFLGPFGGNVINILIPRLQNEFNTSFYTVSLGISLYMIAFAAFQLISGLVSDIAGRRNVVLFGYGTFGIGCLVCYFSRDIDLFLSGRLIQGMGNAFMTPVLMALLGDVVPGNDIGKHMGYFGSVQTSGIFLAPLMGGIFAQLNWRYLFLILSILSVLLMVIYYEAFINENRTLKRQPVSISQFKEYIKDKRVFLLSLSSFAGYFGFGSLGFLFAKYIYLDMHVSETINGLIVSLTGLASIIFSPIVGRLGDKYDRSVISMVGIAPIVVLIFLIPYTKSTYIMSLILFIMGGFSAMVWSSLNTLTVDTAPAMRGAASSIVNSFKYFSFSLSPVFYGMLYQTSGISIAFKAASMVVLFQLMVMIVFYSGRKYDYIK